MNKIIISAFPGTGKTHFTKNAPKNIKVYDSDSSEFSWVDIDGNRFRSTLFPYNYMAHISNLYYNTDVDLIFVSTHKEIRDQLINSKMHKLFIYPSIDLKEEYIRRFKERGSSDDFIKKVNLNWNNWIIEMDRLPEEKIILKTSDQTITDIVKLFL